MFYIYLFLFQKSMPFETVPFFLSHFRNIDIQRGAESLHHFTVMELLKGFRTKKRLRVYDVCRVCVIG